MNRKKLLIRIASLIFFIFIVNYLAGKFYWYSAIWYFDMPMHFLGGLWLGLASIWFLSPQKSFLKPSFVFQIILIVFLIGTCWELFEIVFYNYVAQNSFNILDTVSDIFLDLAGGIFSIFYFLKRIMLESKDSL